MKDVLYSLHKIPRWVSELHDHELERVTISLAGTINPNPNKYRMVKMNHYVLSGMADLEEYVEMEVTDAADEADAKSIATRELLATHPEYTAVEWSMVDEYAH
jgi:hypothetical protein